MVLWLCRNSIVSHAGGFLQASIYRQFFHPRGGVKNGYILPRVGIFSGKKNPPVITNVSR